MSSFVWLLGLVPEAVQLIREVVAAVRAGDTEAAKRAAERAAIVQGFRLAQQAKRAAK